LVSGIFVVPGIAAGICRPEFAACVANRGDLGNLCHVILCMVFCQISIHRSFLFNTFKGVQ